MGARVRGAGRTVLTQRDPRAGPLPGLAEVRLVLSVIAAFLAKALQTLFLSFSLHVSAPHPRPFSVSIFVLIFLLSFHSVVIARLAPTW